MASTPPPPMRIHTPPTPLHGPTHDSWEPYSPRRSMRNTTKRAQQAQIIHSPIATPVKTHKRQHSIITTAATPQRKQFPSVIHAAHALSPPSSPETVYRHKPISGADTVQAGTDDFASQPNTGASHETASFMPTPRRTPRKQASHTRAPSDSIIQTPSKRRARFTLDSPQGPEPTISIFTDSQDRVPDMSPTDENPFVGPRRVRARSEDYIPRRPQTEEEDEMDAAVRRNEGLIYVFRGRKIYRPFADTLPVPSAGETVQASQSSFVRHAAGPSAQRPITRSKLQPRLLFPQTDMNPLGVDVDEEADTDIDDSPIGSQQSVTIRLEDTPETIREDATSEVRKRKSPFDAWPRQKAGRASAGTKRASSAAAAVPEEGRGKRARTIQD